MKFNILLTLSFLFFYSLTQGQKALNGKIVDEDLVELPGAKIFDKDTIPLGNSDWKGNFKIEISENTKELLIASIGFEWKKITLNPKCKDLDLILLREGNYDYKSNKKIDRIRKNRFEKLPKLHSEAIKKNIFQEEPCYREEFIPIKPRLDKIAKEDKVLRKQIKNDFKKLEIGDTIQIPFSGSFRADGTERTSLYVYSYVVENKDFDCIIEGVLLDKNRRKDYLLTIQITDTSNCDFKKVIYEGKELKIGDRILHNMKYFKVLVP
jgi:hypothetical protein